MRQFAHFVPEALTQTSGAALCWLVCCAGVVWGQEPEFTLRLRAPSDVQAQPGSATRYEVAGELVTAEVPPGSGVSGWSFGVTSEGCEIVSITTAGTVVDQFAETAFILAELTAGEGNQGAVSAVALGVSTFVSLPPEGTFPIVQLTAKTSAPEPGKSLDCRVFYRDGLTGSGRAVNTRIALGGRSFTPRTEDTTTRVATPSFTYALTAPPSVRRSGGLSPEFEVHGFLTSAGIVGERGVSAWSLGVVAEGCTIGGITTAETAVEDYQETGNSFTLAELTTGSGNRGAVSAVVLSLQATNTLPPAGRFDVVRLSIEAPAAGPGETAPCRFSFRDGLVGSGLPVRNRISFRRQSYVPTTGPATTLVIGPDPQLTYRLDAPENLAAPARSPARFGAVSTLVSRITSGVGANGWSLGIVADGCDIVEGSMAGTVVDVFSSPGDGFLLTELTTGEGNEGAISVVALNLSTAIALPLRGDFEILRLILETPALAAGSSTVCSIRYHDGLIGSGQPIQNRIAVGGRSILPQTVSAITRVFAEADDPRFVRGDCDGDLSPCSGVSDGLVLLSWLFLGSTVPPCLAACDADGSGDTSLTDALVSLNFCFNGGPPPIPPFPACGRGLLQTDRLLGCRSAPEGCE